MKRIYLDYSATTPVKKEVLDSMIPYFTEYFGNPGSPHWMGQQSKNIIDSSRRTIALYFNSLIQEILFTSGGSESNNWVIQKGGKRDTNGNIKHIISSNIEHSSTMKALQTAEKREIKVTYLKADKTGHINAQQVQDAFTKDTGLVTLSYANSELGTLFPIKEIGEVCKDNNIPFYVDALQAIKYLPIDVNEMNIDYMSIGAHKIYGPKGIGILYVKKGQMIDPLIDGGSQEYNLRAGTENVPAIVGFAKAIELLKRDRAERAEKVKILRDYLDDEILKNISNTFVNGKEPRLPHITNITFKGIPSDSLIFQLDHEGICVSAGSACTSGSLRPSEILLAIGLSKEEASQSLRFSLSEENTIEELDFVIEKLKQIINSIRMI